MLPSPEIEEILFTKYIDEGRFTEFAFNGNAACMNYGEFKDINWLNTPGPIYTTQTDNCGTGQTEAMNNVGGDESYNEVIFKQPCSRQELTETLSAAACDPFGSYYFDGNEKWTPKLIQEWWAKSNERIAYILDNYKYEINLPEPLDRPLYGPREAIPQNYKSWLDFYQHGMKSYLEWYMFKLSEQRVTLPELNFDWKRKEELDKLLEIKKRL